MDGKDKGRAAFDLHWRALAQKVSRATYRGDAEDLLHSAFVRLRSARTAQPVTNTDGFLMRTAINLGIDRHREERRKALDAEPIDWDAIRDTAPLQDEVLAARQKLALIDAVLSGLGGRTRTIFLMHRLDGIKHRDIAARLGISQGTVEKHIARAVLALARAVDPS
ncbi:sigma-70 family RNA polymerase sigma factor [Brevundimonas sp.]|jgi:RNA polymerase sigma factor (sigma-70 family)|uniref:sigma-70 family RNA polymerase sigma factor n=1 Tax=Brevundimonas sp. TaxID=1871086 RepID=UPI0037C04356